MEMAQRTVFVDPFVTQNIGAEYGGKSSIGERQVVDRARAYWSGALACRTCTGLEVEIQPNHGPFTVLPRQARKKTSCPATGIENGTVEFIELCSPGRHEEVRVHRGEPPHPVFNPVELVVLGGIHSNSFSAGREIKSSGAAGPRIGLRGDVADACLAARRSVTTLRRSSTRERRAPILSTR